MLPDVAALRVHLLTKITQWFTGGCLTSNPQQIDSIVHSSRLGMAFEVHEAKSINPPFIRMVERRGFFLAVRENRDGTCGIATLD